MNAKLCGVSLNNVKDNKNIIGYKGTIQYSFVKCMQRRYIVMYIYVLQI